ncbi:MAG: hypothetical protein CMB34_05085 [Euryarchaeota archaeon]|nr:hypothetical protein [Euryarchaeota archaeon]
MTTPLDDYETNNEKQVFVVKDQKAALAMKRAEAKAAREKYKAVVAREREEANAKRAMQRDEIKLELARIRLMQPASQKARANLAISAPAILVLLVGGFIFALTTDSIPEDSVSVASALLTLLVTGLMANLRSIISEGGPADEPNGNGHDAPKPPKKAATTPKK